MKIDIPVFKIRASIFIIGLILIPFIIGLIKDVSRPKVQKQNYKVHVYEKRIK